MKNNFLKIIALLAICFPFCAFGQQPIQYSLYMLNPYSFNSAYAGMDESLSMTGVFRKQWVALEGSPISQNFNAHMPWYYLSGGLGLDIENDILGAERNTRFTLSYNYIYRFKGQGMLSAGLGAGLVQKSIDGNKLRAPDGNYEGNTINHNDNFLPLGKVNGIAPVVDFGLYYKDNRMQIGISANNLLQSNVKYELINTTKIEQLRSYFFIFAYDFEIGERFGLSPSVHIKSDFVQTQGELSLVVKYDDSIFGGTSFRGYNKNTIDAVVFFAGMHVTEKITVAYSYDLSMSSLKEVNKGSHEIMINYNLRKEIGGAVPAKVIYNPRLF